MGHAMVEMTRKRLRQAQERVMLGDRVYFSLSAENTTDKEQTLYAIGQRFHKAEIRRGLS